MTVDSTKFDISPSCRDTSLTNVDEIKELLSIGVKNTQF